MPPRGAIASSLSSAPRGAAASSSSSAKAGTAVAPVPSPAAALPPALSQAPLGAPAALHLTPIAVPPSGWISEALPKKLAEAHPHDKAELASLLVESTQRNIGTQEGFGSGPTDPVPADLSSIINDAVQKDAVQEAVVYHDPDQTEQEGTGQEEEGTCSGPTMQTGVSDPEFGDGRVPTEANWGLEDLPERVSQHELAYVIRRRCSSSNSR